VDSAGLRCCRRSDRGESVARPSRSFLNRTGYHPARDTVFQFLAPANHLVENGGRMNVRNLFAVKQRNVYKVAISYAVLAWFEQPGRKVDQVTGG